ncbi:pyruvate dehydrogenase E1 component subunit alpha [Holospora obtusa F1]|uniref:Pyruvate dehydrogenase E1 component subunit alpha n=1 Tax=Holospora obtusa F1 TaxID=1399147 RepID=W6TEK1_HOLOB|nr:thiamine pyrophosphate-dependent enzyme [Holospora obtusa]ETZ07224.1 pyruvate dehydrogenase E1 component subunit alpha [Holospora obtusa F1]
MKYNYVNNFSDEILSNESVFSSSQSVQVFFEMLFIRRFEEYCVNFYTQGKIRGFCHLCIGQEALPVALKYTRDAGDSVITAYRCHGHILACGADPSEVMLELLGMEGGISKGKGGSMHLFSPQHGFYGGHGIVGASSALGAGLAFAHKYRSDKGICIACLGDGATNQGQFFESMNMAALWGLPVLYIIENNYYSMGTSVERGCANAESLWSRGQAFGIPGYVCHGDDFFEVLDCLKRCIEEVRQKKSPVLLEMRAHRFKGHSMSDPGNYRSKESLKQVKQSQDPIKNLKNVLQEKYGVSVDEIRAEEVKVEHILQNILRVTQEAHLVPINCLDDHVYREI